MDLFLSIIVPVYNSEKTIGKCIDSIINQPFKDWELLLINDGSIDNSGKICDDYALIDSRIKVFHKENEGVSSARNVGLDNVNGEWVIFIDSDDYLMPKALEIGLLEYNEDLLLFSYCVSKSEAIKEVKLSPILLNTQEQLKYFYKANLFKQILKTPWSKIYRAKKIGQLRFDTKVRVGEDFLFNLCFFNNVESCRVFSQYLYMYKEDEMFFYKKYQMTVDDSVYVMSSLFDAYTLLNIKCSNFEKWLFLDYRNLCINDIYKHPNLWYKNYKVRFIYNSIKNILGFEYRLKYKLLSIPLIFYIKAKLR